ncbi:expression protein 9 homolog, mitochondrial [Seminavis robusta]|uniref:Expression protein 9 homolog, mitochondrial n=1 Tax=Seminavis robusta TaxID=568900 RepID=A0A9N8D7R8_9STRA|nr:expression protein 9 homolog, mitochondrial [Seminavis robusta]|eukprot:Sro9_g007270.1 expression protein 9 homolog, mitochondrial (278) ;mRNA; r:97355-98188
MSLLFQRLHSLFEESSGMMELTKLKDKVQEASGHFDEATNMVQQCRETVAEAQTAHDQAHKKHVSLLMRREEWSAEDAQDFVQMTAVEVTTRQALLNAQNSLKQAEQRAVQCQHSYMDIMRQRYHEEQMWQDKWRLLGTYGTWSLIAINTMVFVVGQYFTQAREMKRLKHMEELLLLNKSQNPSDPTITPEEKKADSSLLVEPSVESDQVAKESKDTADTVDHTSTQQQTIPVSSRRGLDDDVTVELFGLSLHTPSLALGAAVSASLLIVVSLFSRR